MKALVGYASGTDDSSTWPTGTSCELTHCDSDTFTFDPTGENAPKSTFSGNTALENFDDDGLGRFTK